MRALGRIRSAVLVALAAGLTFAATAQAAITGSSITTPSDPSFLIGDDDAATQNFTISGTTTGGTPATDKVDVRCYSSTGSVPLKTGISLNPDGTFSATDAAFPSSDGVCRLRAVPAAMSPADPTPFAGPVVGFGERGTSTVPPGPNGGTIYDYYIYGQQLTAAFDYDSLGSCGIDDGYLFDDTLDETSTTWYCNAWFDVKDAVPPTRSGIQVDGANAYAAYGAHGINQAAAGLPALAYSYTLDPLTGNLVIHESQPLVKCPAPTYPPNATSCASFVPTGVTDTRTIVQDHDGHLSTVTDVFSSTDHAAHALDMLWYNAQRFFGSSGDASNLAFQFPGESGFATRAVGDVVSLPSAAPGTILVRMDGAADGDKNTGRGALVYDRPASSAKFIVSQTSNDVFNLHQTGTVPAGGSTTFRFAYAQAYTDAEVAALAQGASSAFRVPPAVHIGSPANGAVVHTSAVTVSGTATDDIGVASLTVGGHAVAVGPGGAWSTTVTLNQGANTITAVARDDTGNTAQDHVAVTYQPTTTTPPPKPKCKVPKLKGKTLKAAKKALKKAHCRAGKTSRKRSKKIRKGRVISSKPKAGKKLPNNAKVKLTLSKGR
jgi:hypothetical protein